MFIPAWGVLAGIVLLVWLFAMVMILKRKANTLEAQADRIEELKEAKAKRRNLGA